MTNSKQKGKRGELELAHKLSEFGYDVRRTAQYNGKELESKADVVGIEGLHIECKRVENLNVSKALEQAQRDCKTDEIPVVMHRKNGEDWKCTLSLDDFMKIWGKTR